MRQVWVLNKLEGETLRNTTSEVLGRGTIKDSLHFFCLPIQSCDFNGRRGILRFLMLAMAKIKMPVNLFSVILSFESVSVYVAFGRK